MGMGVSEIVSPDRGMAGLLSQVRGTVSEFPERTRPDRTETSEKATGVRSTHVRTVWSIQGVSVVGGRRETDKGTGSYEVGGKK